MKNQQTALFILFYSQLALFLHTNVNIHYHHRANVAALLRSEATGAMDYDRATKARGLTHGILGV